METSQLIVFNLALLAALISPGPALMHAISITLRSGRGAGVATGIGLALMACLWTSLALLGLDALFSLFPWLYVAMKLGGAAYLLWLAWQTWRQATEPAVRKPVGRSRAFVGGFSVNLANPKSVFFAASVLVVIFPRELGTLEMVAIVANHFLVEVLVYSVLALALSAPAVASRYLRIKRWLDRFCAIVLGALGLRLLLDQR